MRPAEFTQDQIIEAGQALIAAGRNVTGFALRQRVGGGNPNRLKQVWDEHQASQSVVTAEPVAELPVEVAEQLQVVTAALTERLAALAVDLNDKAVKGSERRVAEVVRAAGEQREQAERELADASQTVDDLELQLDQGNERIAQLEQRLAAAQASAQAQAVELAQVRERLAAVEQSARQASDQAAQREADLQSQLEDTRRAEQAAREREAQAAGALAAAEKRHLEDADVIERLRTELRTTGDALAKSEAHAEVCTAQLNQAQQDLQAARTETKTAEKLAAEATGREQAAQAQIQSLRSSLEKGKDTRKS